MKARMLVIGLMLSGCVTVNDATSEQSARWKNAGIGAAIGCVVTGPFCLLPIGPIIGAIIGGASSVEEKKEEVATVSASTEPKVEKLAPIQSPFGEKQKNFYK